MKLCKQATDNDIEVLELIKKRHSKADKTFISSNEFSKELKKASDKIKYDSHNKYVHLKGFIALLRSKDAKKKKRKSDSSHDSSSAKRRRKEDGDDVSDSNKPASSTAKDDVADTHNDKTKGSGVQEESKTQTIQEKKEIREDLKHNTAESKEATEGGGDATEGGGDATEGGGDATEGGGEATEGGGEATEWGGGGEATEGGGGGEATEGGGDYIKKVTVKVDDIKEENTKKETQNQGNIGDSSATLKESEDEKVTQRAESPQLTIVPYTSKKDKDKSLLIQSIPTCKLKRVCELPDTAQPFTDKTVTVEKNLNDDRKTPTKSEQNGVKDISADLKPVVMLATVSKELADSVDDKLPDLSPAPTYVSLDMDCDEVDIGSGSLRQVSGQVNLEVQTIGLEIADVDLTGHADSDSDCIITSQPSTPNIEDEDDEQEEDEAEEHEEGQTEDAEQRMEGEAEKEEPPVDETDDGPMPIKGSKKQLQKLETLLERISAEIQKLENRELTLNDLDDEDSAYALEDRYKKKFVKVWDKYCEIAGRPPTTGRPTERKFRFDGTRHPEINRKIERFVNIKRLFPDYQDILDIVGKCNKKYHLHIKIPIVKSLAREAFTLVGNELQKRRLLDFSTDFGTRVADKPASAYNDPALFDRGLRERLTSNKKIYQDKMAQVLEKFARKQDDGDDTDDSDEEDWDDDEEEDSPVLNRVANAEEDEEQEEEKDDDNDDDDDDDDDDEEEKSGLAEPLRPAKTSPLGQAQSPSKLSCIATDNSGTTKPATQGTFLSSLGLECSSKEPSTSAQVYIDIDQSPDSEIPGTPPVKYEVLEEHPIPERPVIYKDVMKESSTESDMVTEVDSSSGGMQGDEVESFGEVIGVKASSKQKPRRIVPVCLSEDTPDEDNVVDTISKASSENDGGVVYIETLSSDSGSFMPIAQSGDDSQEPPESSNAARTDVMSMPDSEKETSETDAANFSAISTLTYVDVDVDSQPEKMLVEVEESGNEQKVVSESSSNAAKVDVISMPDSEKETSETDAGNFSAISTLTYVDVDVDSQPEKTLVEVEESGNEQNVVSEKPVSVTLVEDVSGSLKENSGSECCVVDKTKMAQRSPKRAIDGGSKSQTNVAVLAKERLMVQDAGLSSESTNVDGTLTKPIDVDDLVEKEKTTDEKPHEKTRVDRKRSGQEKGSLSQPIYVDGPTEMKRIALESKRNKTVDKQNRGIQKRDSSTASMDGDVEVQQKMTALEKRHKTTPEKQTISVHEKDLLTESTDVAAESKKDVTTPEKMCSTPPKKEKLIIEEEKSLTKPMEVDSELHKTVTNKEGMHIENRKKWKISGQKTGSVVEPTLIDAKQGGKVTNLEIREKNIKENGSLTHPINGDVTPEEKMTTPEKGDKTPPENQNKTIQVKGIPNKHVNGDGAVEKKTTTPEKLGKTTPKNQKRSEDQVSAAKPYIIDSELTSQEGAMACHEKPVETVKLIRKSPDSRTKVIDVSDYSTTTQHIALARSIVDQCEDVDEPIETLNEHIKTTPVEDTVLTCILDVYANGKEAAQTHKRSSPNQENAQHIKYVEKSSPTQQIGASSTGEVRKTSANKIDRGTRTLQNRIDHHTSSGQFKNKNYSAINSEIGVMKSHVSEGPPGQTPSTQKSPKSNSEITAVIKATQSIVTEQISENTPQVTTAIEGNQYNISEDSDIEMIEIMNSPHNSPSTKVKTDSLDLVPVKEKKKFLFNEKTTIEIMNKVMADARTADSGDLVTKTISDVIKKLSSNVASSVFGAEIKNKPTNPPNQNKYNVLQQQLNQKRVFPKSYQPIQSFKVLSQEARRKLSLNRVLFTDTCAQPRSVGAGRDEPVSPKSASRIVTGNRKFTQMSAGQNGPLSPRSLSKSRNGPVSPRSLSAIRHGPLHSRSASHNGPLSPRSLSQSRYGPVGPRSLSAIRHGLLNPRSANHNGPLSQKSLAAGRNQPASLNAQSMSTGRNGPISTRPILVSQKGLLSPRSASHKRPVLHQPTFKERQLSSSTVDNIPVTSSSVSAGHNGRLNLDLALADRGGHRTPNSYTGSHAVPLNTNRSNATENALKGRRAGSEIEFRNRLLKGTQCMTSSPMNPPSQYPVPKKSTQQMTSDPIAHQLGQSAEVTICSELKIASYSSLSTGAFVSVKTPPRKRSRLSTVSNTPRARGQQSVERRTLPKDRPIETVVLSDSD